MKTTLFAAFAAIAFATSAVAGGVVETAPAPVVVDQTPNTVGISFELTARDLNNGNDFGDVWSLRAGYEVLTYNLGAGVSTLEIYGELGEVRGNEYGTLGAEYSWAVEVDRTTFQLAGDVAYVMFNDFGDGDFIVTPSAMVSFDLGRNVDLYSEVGYSWDATNDWNRLGGYAEMGHDVGVTDNFAVRASVVQPFDTLNDDVYGELGVRFEF